MIADRSSADRGTHGAVWLWIRMLVSILVLGAILGACHSTPPQPADAPEAAPPHGDHNPRHGGLVLMKGDLHYEVVFDATGRRHRVFFSDAVRRELAPSVASAVTLSIARPDGSTELIPLAIDPDQTCWMGSGRPVADPQKTGVRVSFTVNAEPYWIDLPFATAPPPPQAKTGS